MCVYDLSCFFFFFFQAEDGIRDSSVTGVQTCALPIYGAESFAQKARITADNDFDSCPIRFLRRHVTRDAVHGPLDIGKCELFGHHGPPSRCAKLDLRRHRLPRMLRVKLESDLELSV